MSISSGGHLRGHSGHWLPDRASYWVFIGLLWLQRPGGSADRSAVRGDITRMSTQVNHLKRNTPCWDNVIAPFAVFHENYDGTTHTDRDELRKRFTTEHVDWEQWNELTDRTEFRRKLQAVAVFVPTCRDITFEVYSLHVMYTLAFGEFTTTRTYDHLPRKCSIYGE